jgi:hypothetical protein
MAIAYNFEIAWSFELENRSRGARQSINSRLSFQAVEIAKTFGGAASLSNPYSFKNAQG